ncbi:AFL098Wp [Eremothecium gossypii ATCC 10895]|uniref:Alpha-1,3/1,6-mannosyltransferase ALG2 n=1 Tax=Eremothecium gossypii (strain ATCC 10895 / CBS 109.51 / FGSC 9923 / NRRL Y-1056) TaxID=284811 RepID=ALG2_EREGS|nr:AFL098Wp [Eremothecium gossypii ATCC 10895]Q755C1.1 RecName: Full=Alpha-1,3/1,6-mannosyltransferase ALG2; AltName: Full=Asparagine-linked glycosylation protein 2; AltName: Full=GDP-Man:Man(1)GlcNAc(2)-PP-Dol alpha-1,3-mannosyltransferase; AltName: Full=GDP-Man:Man(1)GlcNAc(2)-PP-dolichol mannosyltransferase; AltName: Full=GDP-Man:Man(2)GlcNAc(2)-PP-Dol alpha-1,6-mannosyltransferase [Eremothecium gossypii ATCC 10895]AAS53276.1 AFL098Wp [Eremothecium gossypii ATCC 10895]AEY97586.1 FAFL098Wp [Er
MMTPLNIALIHPDLGIGGAERLVVDAAIGLQDQGHRVTIYTSHCDKNHCFEEIKRGDLKVVVVGDFLPTNILGKFFILCANLRQLALVFKLVINGSIDKHDLFIVDQLSTCVPLLHLFSASGRVLFYCHFPDQLLAQRKSLVSKLYRVPFDLLEQLTMGCSDSVVVNSYFTRSVFFDTFKILRLNPRVVYPCVAMDELPIEKIDIGFYDQIIGPNNRYYLSINRFERKKDIALALNAFKASKEGHSSDTKLIICGGYDSRVAENVEYLSELQLICEKANIAHVTIFYSEFSRTPEHYTFPTGVREKKVIFLASISSSLKELLLKKAQLLLYTPSREHFGIVPLEAMKHGTPVLAVDNGGPLETVVTLKSDNQDTATGWLRRADAGIWAEAIDEQAEYVKKNPGIFATNGPKWVKDKFSRDAMTSSFLHNIDNIFMTDRVIQPWAVMVILAASYILWRSSHVFGDACRYIYLLTGGILVLRSRYLLAIFWVLLFVMQPQLSVGVDTITATLKPKL